MKPPYPSYVLDRIGSIAADTPDEEVGGVVVATPGAWRTIAIENVSSQPDRSYIPFGLGLINASQLGHLEFYWHTHINGNPNFSPTDITGIWETNIPWLLYDLRNDVFNYFDPNLKTPLLGRQWQQGLTDCWALVRDFYRWELDIELPPPECDHRAKPWKYSDWNPFLQQLPRYFDKVQIKHIEPYDLVLFKNPVANYNPAHISLVLPTELGLELLTHPCKQLSQLKSEINPEQIHSIWRSKCPISPSNYSVLWGVDLGTPTNLQPPNLARASAFSVTSLKDSSKPS